MNFRQHNRKANQYQMKYQASHGNYRCNIYTLDHKTYLCIVHYYSKFPFVKLTDGLSVDSLIKTCKITFVKYRPLRRTISYASTNFVSEKFHNSAGTWIFIKLCPHNITIRAWTSRSMYKVLLNGPWRSVLTLIIEVYLPLLQIHSTPNDSGLPSQAALLFNRPTWGLMSKLSRPPHYLITMMIIMLPW